MSLTYRHNMKEQHVLRTVRFFYYFSRAVRVKFIASSCSDKTEKVEIMYTFSCGLNDGKQKQVSRIRDMDLACLHTAEI